MFQIEVRRKAFPSIAVVELLLEDDIRQQLCIEDLIGVSNQIHTVLSTESSVLGKESNIFYNFLPSTPKLFWLIF